MARSSGATPNLIPHSLTIKGPNPWADVSAYGAKFDGISKQTFTTTSGSPNISVPTGGPHTGFTGQDIGKRVVVIQYTSGWLGVFVEANVFTGTILAVSNSTNIVVSGNVSASLSSTAGATPSGKIIWGTDDSVSIQAALDTLMTTAYPQGGEIFLPPGIAMIGTKLHSYSQSIKIVGGGGAFSDGRFEYGGTTLVGCTAGMTVFELQGHNVQIDGVVVHGGGKLAAKGWHFGTPGGVIGWSLLIHIKAVSCVDGIYIDGNIYDLTLLSCQGTSNTRGIAASKTGSDAIQKMTLIDVIAEFNTEKGGSFYGVEKLHITDGGFQTTGGTSPATGGAGLYIQNCPLLRLDSVHLEANKYFGINFEKEYLLSSVYAAQQVVLDSCWITSTGQGGTNGRGVKFGGVVAARLDNNRFDNNPGGHIESSNASLTGLDVPRGSVASAVNSQIYVGPENLFINGGTAFIAKDGISLQQLDHVYAARVTRLAVQSIPYNIQTYLTYTAVHYDPDGMLNAGALVVPFTGWYDINWCLRFAAGAGGQRAGYVVINRTTVIDEDLAGTSATIHSVVKGSTRYYLAAGDRVEIQVFQDQTAGTALDVQFLGNFSPILSMRWVGP